MYFAVLWIGLLKDAELAIAKTTAVFVPKDSGDQDVKKAGKGKGLTMQVVYGRF